MGKEVRPSDSRRSTPARAATRSISLLAAAAAFAVSALNAHATNPPLVTTLVDSTAATNGASIAAFAYDDANDTFWVASFGSGATIRKVTGGVGTTYVSSTTWFYWMRDGDPTRTGGQPVVGGMMFNPVALAGGTIAANSRIYITDGAAMVRDGGTVNRPDLSKHIYDYNLGLTTVEADGYNVFNALMTRQDMQTAIGSTNTSDSLARQSAWSIDGQAIYSVDSSTAYGGIWKTDAVTGGATRLVAVDINVEPVVLPSASGDKIYVNAPDDDPLLAGGIDYYVHDGVTTSGRNEFLTAAQLMTFLQTASTPDIRSMTADSDGNIYMHDITTRNLIRWDAATGELTKVISRDQRKELLGISGTPNANMLRMSVREVTAPGGFTIPQIMYVETSGVNTIAGVNIYKPGDFNGDNVLDSADLDLFKPAITVAGVLASTDNLYYDLNGNGVVDGWDVFIVLRLFDLPEGDANMDGQVNVGDLGILASNWNGTGKTWLQADYNYDGVVNVGDLGVLASNWNAGVTSFSEALALFPELAGAAVPEPASLGLLVFGAAALLRRRRS